MKILILSDIHANKHALNTILKNETYDQIYCAGDLVGYYANPNEVIDICISKNIKSVKGRHDLAAYDLNTAELLDYYSRLPIKWTNKILSNKNKDFLKQLPYVLKDGDFTIVHGRLGDGQQFETYLEHSYELIGKDIHDAKTRFLVSGNTHIPAFFEGPEDFSANPIKIEYNQEYFLNPNYKYYINPGSTSQPRNDIIGGVYVIYDSDRDSITFKTFKYNLFLVLDDLVINGLPLFNYHRLFPKKVI